MSAAGPDAATPAARVLALLRARGQTVAVAESLTGGLVCDALVAVPGASRAVAGGIVAYTVEAKIGVLGLPAALVAEHGTVSARTAEAMATAARERFGSTWGAATTGVAGPEPSEGHAVGTVYVAVAGEERVLVRALRLHGERPQIRAGTVEAVLSLVEEALAAVGGNDTGP